MWMYQHDLTLNLICKWWIIDKIGPWNNSDCDNNYNVVKYISNFMQYMVQILPWYILRDLHIHIT